MRMGKAFILTLHRQQFTTYISFYFLRIILNSTLDCKLLGYKLVSVVRIVLRLLILSFCCECLLSNFHLLRVVLAVVQKVLISVRSRPLRTLEIVLIKHFIRLCTCWWSSMNVHALVVCLTKCLIVCLLLTNLHVLVVLIRLYTMQHCKLNYNALLIRNSLKLL